MADQLAWSIPGEPCDFKDIMVTQSLLSIGDTFPYHWRGERSLKNFQKAFVGLLGADPMGSNTITEEPTDEQMDDFITFMRSLQAPANPIESFLRQLDDKQSPDAVLNGMFGSAVRGQDAFQNVVNFNGNTCAECHPLESGTVGNLFSEVASVAPRAIQLESTHLRQLQNKGTTTTTLTAGVITRVVNVNGFGSTHNGLVPTVFNFIFDTPAFSNLTDQERVDTVKFVEQFDQGISPACHWGSFYEQGSHPRIPANIGAILLQGARKGWNDVAAFGRLGDGAGTLLPARLWFDPSINHVGAFVTEDPSAATITWGALMNLTDQGLAEFVYIGLPPKNGKRFAIDPDRDGLITGEELNQGTDPLSSDSDRDTWWDGHEFFNGDDPTTPQTTSSDTTLPDLVDVRFDYANARVAKYHVQFSEDVTYEIAYSVVGPTGPPGVRRTFTRDYFTTCDTFTLRHSEPSDPDDTDTLLTYRVSITMTDRNDNERGPINLPSFQPARTQNMEGVSELTHVANLEWIKEDRVGTTLDAEVRITIDSNQTPPLFDPEPGIMVFCIVSVVDQAENRFEQSNTFTTTLPTSFDVIDNSGVVTTYNGNGTPGPFIVSNLTDSAGQTVIDFQQPNLTTGQTVKVSVMGTVFPADGQPDGTFNQLDLLRMQLLLLENASELKTDF